MSSNAFTNKAKAAIMVVAVVLIIGLLLTTGPQTSSNSGVSYSITQNTTLPSSPQMLAFPNGATVSMILGSNYSAGPTYNISQSSLAGGLLTYNEIDAAFAENYTLSSTGNFLLLPTVVILAVQFNNSAEAAHNYFVVNNATLEKLKVPLALGGSSMGANYTVYNVSSSQDNVTVQRYYSYVLYGKYLLGISAQDYTSSNTLFTRNGTLSTDGVVNLAKAQISTMAS